MLPEGLRARVDTCGLMAGEPTWSWDHAANPRNSHYLFWLVVGGSGRLTAGDDQYDLRAGDCLLSPMTDAHVGRHGSRGRLHVLWTVYRYVGLRGRTVQPEPPPPRQRAVQDAGLLEQMGRRLLEAHSDKHDPWQSAQWMQAVLVEVARQDATPRLSGLDLDHYERVRQICNALRAEPRLRLPLKRMAEMAGYTPNHFIRIFVRFMGMTPGEFTIENRIEHARRLLRSTSLSVAGVASELGYGDPYYFTKQFSERVGVSPSRYRKS